MGACLLLHTLNLTEGPFVPGLPSWELPYADQGPREAPGCSATQAHASPLASPGCLKVRLCPTGLGVGQQGLQRPGRSGPTL